MIAGLALSAMTAILYYAAARHPVKPVLRWGAYKRLYSYGARVSVTQFLEFITSNMDTMSAGHYFNAGGVGTYTRGLHVGQHARSSTSGPRSHGSYSRRSAASKRRPSACATPSCLR